MQAKQMQKTFVVHDTHSVSPTHTGNHLAIGTDALVATVMGQLGSLSKESKERLRSLIEGSQEAVVERFRGLTSLSLYNEAENRRIDVRLIMSGRGA